MPEVTGKIKVSPRARAMAAKMGISLNAIAGSGPNGRIIARDIENYKVTSSESASDEYSETAVSNVRKIIARAMHESLSRSAQLTHHMSADARKILAFRKQIKSEQDKGASLNITLNDMICFCVIEALQKHPDMNGHFLGETTRKYNRIHLGLLLIRQEDLWCLP
jgi:pyruvate dehydrogenase E2 component (dihydrolipoamide acetyltransferase)